MSIGLREAEQEKSKVVILLIDLINDFEFEGSESLIARTSEIIPNVLELKKRGLESKVPVIYVNDNFGKWRSDFKNLVRHCTTAPRKGAAIVTKIKPKRLDYFILKPKHSAFYSTALDVLLDHFGATTLVLAGIAADICVLFTANDAYMRNYKLIIPKNCIAANSAQAERYAGEQMKELLRADVRPLQQIKTF